MTRRLYLMPYTSQSVARGDGTVLCNAPKYLSEIRPHPWGCMALDEWCVVRVEAPPAVHTTLGAHPDVEQSPPDLSRVIGPLRLAALIAAVEAAGFPGNRIEQGMTWRQVFRILCKSAQFRQRARDRTGVLRGIPLTTEYQNLSAEVQTHLLRAADDQGFDLRALPGTTPFRRVLRLAGEHFTGTIRIGNEDI